MFFLILGAAVAAFVWWQQTRGNPDYFVRVQGDAPGEFWVYDLRALWVELRGTADAFDAKQRYELRRVAAEHWELRLATTRPAGRSLVFPAPSLRALESEHDEAAIEQTWHRCAPSVEQRLEAAYRKYNLMDD